MSDHTASCHCGNLRAKVNLSALPADVQVRACQCSFCRKHGALTIGDAKSFVRFEAEQPQTVERYRFGSKTSDFLVCRRCGVYVGAVCKTPAGLKGIVNLNTVDDRAVFTGTPEAMNYDGEDLGSRVDRRAARWMNASVSFQANA